jgi:hypothetical protein
MVRSLGYTGSELADFLNDAIDVVDGCAGRPAKGRRWKSVTVKV